MTHHRNACIAVQACIALTFQFVDDRVERIAIGWRLRASEPVQYVC